MRADDPDFPKISHLIGSDASLAAAMLQTVNSAFYGLRTKATSVRQAIVLLGLSNVTQLVTSVLMRNSFPDCDSELMDEYWQSSLTIAQVSKVLAGKFKGVNRDEAHTFALFRDCGMLAMMDAYQDYVPLFAGAETPDGVTVTALENERHKIDHALVGYNLTKMWLLPEDICQSVLWHHDYAVLRDGAAHIPAACIRHVALALVAERIFVQRSRGIDSQAWRDSGDFAQDILQVSREALDAVTEEITQDTAIF